jgi:hypothetical protein
MTNVELPRATHRRFKAEDFRSEAFLRDALERERSEDEMNCGGSVNLQKLEEQLARGPLDEIAALMRALTYGEMIELAEGLWNVNGQGSEISKTTCPDYCIAGQRLVQLDVKASHRISRWYSIFAGPGAEGPIVARFDHDAACAGVACQNAVTRSDARGRHAPGHAIARASRLAPECRASASPRRAPQPS